MKDLGFWRNQELQVYEDYFRYWRFSPKKVDEFIGEINCRRAGREKLICFPGKKTSNCGEVKDWRLSRFVSRDRSTWPASEAFDRSSCHSGRTFFVISSPATVIQLQAILFYDHLNFIEVMNKRHHTIFANNDDIFQWMCLWAKPSREKNGVNRPARLLRHIKFLLLPIPSFLAGKLCFGGFLLLPVYLYKHMSYLTVGLTFAGRSVINAVWF